MPLLRLSPSARYALSALAYLARRPEGDSRSLAEIAKGRPLPRSFLSKVLRDLARRGLVVSRRGPGGGHALARAPREIFLADIVAAAEPPPSGARRCLLELRGCSGREPCALHERIVASERAVWSALGSITLEAYALGQAAARRTSDGDT